MLFDTEITQNNGFCKRTTNPCKQRCHRSTLNGDGDICHCRYFIYTSAILKCTSSVLRRNRSEIDVRQMPVKAAGIGQTMSSTEIRHFQNVEKECRCNRTWKHTEKKASLALLNMPTRVKKPCTHDTHTHTRKHTHKITQPRRWEPNNYFKDKTPKRLVKKHEKPLTIHLRLTQRKVNERNARWNRLKSYC